MVPHITVCICTCGRPQMLGRLLDALAEQETGNQFTFSIVVTDNDATESARAVTGSFAQRTGIPVCYSVQSRRNIALARNTALEHARGDYIACLDDDEFPVKTWLRDLFQTCQRFDVSGVLGPVNPHFEVPPPAWIIKGGFYDRPRHETGFLMPWQECRTGNVLFRRAILPSGEPAFREQFGTGGEDQDFFRRMIEAGHRFVWCDEAIAYETVPPTRWSRRFMLQRALLRGKNSLRHRKGRLRNLLKSMLAVPAYALALPFLLIAGHHYFMRYCVKLVDHLGRLLASVGLNPADQRPM